MASKNLGALPIQIIRGLMETGYIRGAEESNISPASLDLALSDELYRIGEVVMPRPGESIEQILKEVPAVPHDLKQPLERGTTYLARLREKLNLPRDVYAYTNPKSTSGRNDVHVRLIVDSTPRFDSVPQGFKGDLWLTITPQSFPIKLSPGETLTQIRFFTQDTRLNELELQIAIERDKLLWNLEKQPLRYDDIEISDYDGSVILSMDVSRELVGWECLGTDEVLDFSLKKFHDPQKFFRPLTSTDKKVRLKQGAFYILHTRERLRVPPYLACEMAPMDERSGEFRSHYAGFIDPGWGWGLQGEGTGRPLVLEVRPLFQDIVFRDGQPVGKIRFEHLARLPNKVYDEMNKSNYSYESAVPVLAKHFKTIAIEARLV